MAGHRSTNGREQAAAMPHSRFIPEAERGWRKGVAEKDRLGSSSSSSSSSNNTTTNTTTMAAGSNGIGSRRSSSFLSFASIWSTPSRKPRLTPQEDDEEVIEDEGEDEVQRGHGRERSNSMPTSPTSEDARSYFTAAEPLDRITSSSSSVKRKSLQLPPHEGMLSDGQESQPPSLLTRQSSRAASSLPPMQSSTASNVPPRGFAWHRPVDEGSVFIHPSHRNPTGKQAFYDTHFGSSSGWRSVASMADDVLHPIEHAKLALGRWGGTKKEKRGREAGGEASSGSKADRKRDSLLSWATINSMGIFGTNPSPSESNNGGEEETGGLRRAYEPELIPTIERDPQAHRYFKNLTGNVVVMGGYRGSILRDAETHQMMWVPLKVGVGLRRPTLELGLTRGAEEQSEDRVLADEMLGGIGSLVDMGKRLIQRCSRKQTSVHSWGYDWRLSLGRSSKRLEAFLFDLWQQSADRDEDRQGAKVIAHSMGGLVALHALAMTKRPEIFDAIVFASTPFLGTANILGPFRFGDAALFNDEICSPRATFSFRSSFYLLPVDADKSKGEDNTQGGRCFEEEDGTPHDLDFLDAETWNDIGFSPCVPRGKRQEVLERSKRRAREQGRTLRENLERSASIRDLNGAPTADWEQMKASTGLSFPGPDVQLVSSSDSQAGGRNGMLDRAGEGLMEAARAGQSALASRQAASDEKESLPAGNEQGGGVPLQQQSSMMSQDRWDEVMEDDASASWLYLEHTLAETRQFFHELRTGFQQHLFDQGRYPPLAILTSGRTPTVRGALVAHTSNPSQGPEEWKRGAREGDYSRMLYAPGDGVILRKSSTTLPGQWARLLVRGAEDDKDALTNVEGVVETSHRHVALLSDVDGIGRCLEACRRSKSVLDR